MKKKIISILICTLLISTILPIATMAGSKSDPEIKDNYDDQFGALIEYPTRMRTRIALTLLQMDSFDFIDIDSAWFYEKELESEYLYTALKLKDLEINSQRAIYSIHWTFNGLAYAVGSHLYNNGQNYSCLVGLDKRFNRNWQDAEVTFDFDNDIITFKIDKNHIGNPQPGDYLTKTFAWTALRFNFEALSLIFSDGELVKDIAPFIESSDEYGRNYMIQY